MTFTLKDTLAHWFAELDQDKRIVSLSEPPAGSQETPFVNELPVGLNIADAIGGRIRHARILEDLAAGHPVRNYRYTIAHSLLGTRYYTLSIVPREEGGRSAYRCSITDLTPAIDMHRRLERQERELNTLFEACPNYLIVKDIEGRIVRANAAAEAAFGDETVTIIGKTVKDIAPAVFAAGDEAEDAKVVAAEQALDFEQTITREGKMKVYLATKFPIFDGEGSIIGLGATGHDITQRKVLESELDRRAHRDDLTGFPNRRSCRLRLNEAVLLAQTTDGRVGVIVADIDGFKSINDTLGHQAGDKLLLEVAMRLKECLSGADTVARTSADEFCLILPRLSNEDQLDTIVERINRAFDAPVEIGGHELFVSISLGSAIYPDDADGPEQAMRAADLALLAARRHERGGYRRYAADLRAVIEREATIAASLRKAIDRSEFKLVYQPVVDAGTGRLVSAEALIRWTSDSLGVVRPDHFIPAAEQSGIISQIGAWTLRQACMDAVAWQLVGRRPIRVAVNTSPTQLLSPGFVPLVRQTLEDTGLAANLLKIEVTESALVRDVGLCREILDELRRAGVVLSLDDFGTGYSALSYLQKFHFDELKLDQSFVRKAEPGSVSEALAASIIAMARSLGMKTVAEGVETPHQARFLAANGCDYLQGYYYGRPGPPQDIFAALQSEHSTPLSARAA